MKTATVSKLFAVLVILALGTLLPTLAQNSEAQFQQGLIKEEGEGSLLEAIEIYNEVAADESAGRPLQATAMLHIGLCYEKLGRQEASNTYRNIINNFPDQTETVKVDREKLSLLAQTTVITKAESNEFRIRKVWEGAEDLFGKASPDGKYLSFTDWETGDLAVYELAGGKTRRLTHKGTWEDCSDYAEDSRWSPDGRQIAYGWCDDTGAYDLRIIGLDGSGPEIIYKNEQVMYAIPCDWSPDGKQVLALLQFMDRTMKAALISVEDGSMSVLRSSDEWPGSICLTRDGRHMLYDQPQKENSRVRDIYLLPIKGGQSIPLVQNPADDFLLDITRDGNHVLFSSDRDGTLALYLIQLEEGKPKGEPVLVRSGMGQIQNLGFTPSGSFYYGMSKESTDIYMGELDPASGNFIRPWAKMNTRFQGYNREPAYAPDGKQLAYISVMNPSAANTSGNAKGGDMLVIRSLETEQERNIIPELTHMGFPIWSPDNKFVTVVEWAEKSSMGMHRINVETGQMETLINPDEGIRLFGRHGWSPDGNTLYYGLLSKDFTSFQILSRNLESGKDHRIYESHDILHLSLSPDGSQLAILSISRRVKAYAMHLMPVSGGEARELFRFNKDENIDIAYACTTIWSKDGKYILFLLKDGTVENPSWELCRIPAPGGQIEKLDIQVQGITASSLSMHPDGRHIAFSSTSSPISSAVWVMENFLPLE
ncbi:MAG: tetratricopeptide repeat protein [Bacteroidia bacterium]|nr:MAG: tetratricopeptide repeat protein [Bacteroidia bacterium]